MKKILFLVLSFILLTGCGGKKDSLDSIKNSLSNIDTYKLVGKMSLVSNEDEYIYDVEVGVKDNEYYKVTLLNTINNHEQIILKNDDGVFVVTPNLNKSFKFMSEWPNNSSQSYILGNLVNDIENDNEAKLKKVKDGYEVSSKVNYPNNKKLVKQVIYFDKDYNLKSVKVMDSEDNIIIEVTVGDIDKKVKFSDDYFKLPIENTEEEKNEEEDKDVASIVEDIVYPLYVPKDTYLSSKDHVSDDETDRVILTFSGVDPFILVEERVNRNEELEVIPVNGEPVMLGDVIGAIGNNSIYWTSNGVDYYLTSNTLNTDEMMTIAESTKNSSTLVASTK